MTAKTVAMIIIILYNVKICQSLRYDNYTLFYTTPTNSDQVNFLKNLVERKYIDVIFWKKPNKLHEDVHLIVSPEDKKIFLQKAQHFKLKTYVQLLDVQKAFDNQHIKTYTRSKPESYAWKHYHSLEDVYQYLTDLTAKYPNVTKLTTIGKSVEGRQIMAFSIKTPGNKHKVIVEGGIHGNEWIAVEFVTYLIYGLIGGPRQKMYWSLQDLARKYDWYIVPIVNPDGYVHSQTEDRMWRKNRRYTKNAIGVDLNRNFDYNFGKFDSSNDPLDDYYCGNQSFSEPESQALRNFIHQKRINLRFYFAFHSYGQKLILPFSDRINHIDNFVEMENFGKQAIMKIYKLYGTKYGIGTTYDTLEFDRILVTKYVALMRPTVTSTSPHVTGSVWCVHVAQGQSLGGRPQQLQKLFLKETSIEMNIVPRRYVFTFLLRDTGAYGFALPSSEILPTCEEMTAGLVELMTAKRRRVQLDLFSNNAQLLKLKIFVLFYDVCIILLLK